jgi:DNA-binding NarL/FixJ family response regulator
MNAQPLDLVRSLATAARLVGAEDRHALAMAQGEAVTLDTVLDLLEDLATAAAGDVIPVNSVDRARREWKARVRAMVNAGVRDNQIAEALGGTSEQIRSARRRAGLPGQSGRAPSGWQSTVAALHARGLTNDEIAAETGWTLGTVQQRVWKLGLRSHRKSRAT